MVVGCVLCDLGAVLALPMVQTPNAKPSQGTGLTKSDSADSVRKDTKVLENLTEEGEWGILLEPTLWDQHDGKCLRCVCHLPVGPSPPGKGIGVMSKEQTLVLRTWNIMLMGREPELVHEVERDPVDIVGLTSVHCTGPGPRLLERGWTLIFWTCNQGRCVGYWPRASMSEFCPGNLEIVSVWLQAAAGKVLTVANAPKISANYLTFLESLEVFWKGVPSRNPIFLLGDFKVHMGNERETGREQPAWSQSEWRTCVVVPIFTKGGTTCILQL